jgi:hypothetical protein
VQASLVLDNSRIGLHRQFYALHFSHSHVQIGFTASRTALAEQRCKLYGEMPQSLPFLRRTLPSQITRVFIYWVAISAPAVYIHQQESCAAFYELCSQRCWLPTYGFSNLVGRQRISEKRQQKEQPCQSFRMHPCCNPTWQNSSLQGEQQLQVIDSSSAIAAVTGPVMPGKSMTAVPACTQHLLALSDKLCVMCTAGQFTRVLQEL